MSGLQAVLSFYEGEVGPMLEKVSHAKKCGSLQVKKGEIYSLAKFGALLMCTEVPPYSSFPSSLPL